MVERENHRRSKDARGGRQNGEPSGENYSRKSGKGVGEKGKKFLWIRREKNKEKKNWPRRVFHEKPRKRCNRMQNETKVFDFGGCRKLKAP